MRLAAVFAAVILSWIGPASAQNLIVDFFRYKPTPIPPVGSCTAIAAEIGGAATWYGEFSGRRWQPFNDRANSYAARGCFPDELTCRIWQQQSLTHLDGGVLFYTSCKPGPPQRLLP